MLLLEQMRNKMPMTQEPYPAAQIAAPSATGNAEPHFEAKVGASYILALLSAGEPRGLPGATVCNVASGSPNIPLMTWSSRQPIVMARLLGIQSRKEVNKLIADPAAEPAEAVLGRFKAPEQFARAAGRSGI